MHEFMRRWIDGHGMLDVDGAITLYDGNIVPRSAGEFDIGIDAEGELGTSVGVTMDTKTDGGGE